MIRKRIDFGRSETSGLGYHHSGIYSPQNKLRHFVSSRRGTTLTVIGQSLIGFGSVCAASIFFSRCARQYTANDLNYGFSRESKVSCIRAAGGGTREKYTQTPGNLPERKRSQETMPDWRPSSMLTGAVIYPGLSIFFSRCARQNTGNLTSQG